MISFSNWSTLSWIFSDAGRVAAFLSASANAFLSASETLAPSWIVGVVAPMLLAWGSWFLLASAVAAWSSKSLAASEAEISPFSIAFNRSSLPIAALALSIAASLSVILSSLLIFSIASASIFSKAYLRPAKLSASSFLSSSTLALANSAASLALANSVSASDLAWSAAVFASSAGWTSASSLVALVVASSRALVVSLTFASASATLASAAVTFLSASAFASAAFSASVFTFGFSTGFSAGLGFLASPSLAAFTAAAVLSYSASSFLPCSA